MEDKKCWAKVFKKIKYAKVSPYGLLDGLEIVMYPPAEDERVDNLVDFELDFDMELFMRVFKRHILNEPEQICFPRTC